ncbi:MAG: Demethylmenaquinone methyltransferase [Phycisphaerae bacterium]|nr:Demethylmenaquinone methyltransferase [Phycisphaerae bacterium]
MLDTSTNAHEFKHHARTHFEKWALSYDRSLLNELVFFPSIRRCQEELQRWRRRTGAEQYRALDVGCGTGTLLTLLSADPAAERLIGLDYSANMVAALRAKITGRALTDRVHIIRADSEHLPLADHAVDVLTCCNSFHHYPHQQQVLGEFRRVLRPGGLMVLIDGFRDNVIGWLVFDVAVAGVEKHVHHASWSEVRAMCERAGFSDVRQSKMNVLAPMLVTSCIR